MPLLIHLKFEKTEILLGENPAYTLTLENTGPGKLILPSLDKGSGYPWIKVVTLATGTEKVYKPKAVPPFAFRKTALEVGTPKSEFYVLDDTTTLTAPGQYLISAIYEWDNGQSRAESEPVKITVRQSAIFNLAVDDPTMTITPAVYVNTAGDKVELVYGNLNLEPGADFSQVQVIGKCDASAKPVIGRHMNRKPGAGRYIGWLADGKFSFLHMDEMKGPTGIGSITAKPLSVLTSPIYCAPTDLKSRGSGAALMLSPDPLGNTILRLVNLTPLDPPGAVEGPSVLSDGPMPQWAGNYFRKDKSKIIAMIRAKGGKVTLHAGLWPEEGKNIDSPNQLASWDGTFVAAGATIDEKDVIRGAVLIWMGPKGEESLEVIQFMIGENFKTESEPLGALPWTMQTPIVKSIVRLRSYGTPAMLLRAGTGKWKIFDGLGFEGDVPVPYTSTDQPIDLGFIGDKQAVLIMAEMTGKLAIKNLDGSPIPPIER